jgi:CS domain
MSQLSDYSKFDHLASSSDEEDDHEEEKNDGDGGGTRLVAPLERNGDHRTSGQLQLQHRRHPNRMNATPIRFLFEDRNGTLIYEWEQTLNEVMIYVPTPQTPTTNNNNNTATPIHHQIFCNLSATNLQIGLHGSNRYYINEDFYHPIVTTESTWYWDSADHTDDDGGDGRNNNVMVICLQKVAKGMVWEAALRGHHSNSDNDNRRNDGSNSVVVLDPVSLQLVQKELLLERWQEENPGMDFRDATFNGSIPDPRTYMGGVRYD